MKRVAIIGIGLLVLGVPGFGLAQQQRRILTNDDLAPSTVRESAPADSSAQSTAVGRANKEAPYVPTPMEIVDRMLDVAGVTSSDVVYDLGSGDGRIVLRAAQRFGAKSVGVEIEPALVKLASERASEMGLAKLASFVQGDVFQTDVRPVSVLALYLVTEMNERLRPILEKQLRPGTRIVAHDMPVPGWNPVSEEKLKLGLTTHTIYLYTVPQSYPKPTN